MINIFKENKKLKEENNKLKIKVNELQKENTDGQLKMQEYYESLMNKRIEYIQANYNTKMERKKEVTKIAKLFENRIKEQLEFKTIIDIEKNNIFSLDVTNDIENYFKILKYLKEN